MQISQPISGKPWSVLIATLLVIFTAATSHAPSYSIDWHKIAGGSGASSGGAYEVSGTFGQADATQTSGGGNYSMVGGFVSIISVLQTAGLPNLSIAHTDSQVILFWPNTAQCRLLQKSDLAAADWTTSSNAIFTVNGTNRVAFDSPVGNLFFRLIAP